MTMPTDEWLQQINEEFRSADVPAGRRPFEALDRYCIDYGVRGVLLGSPPANRIFEWFSANTKPEAHQIGSLFTGAYHFDSCFWAVEIPIGYGRFRLDAPDSLRGMPLSVKNSLTETPKSAWDYVEFWADCVDYAFGVDDILKTTSLPFARSLVENGDRELRAAVAQLLEHRPNTKAAMSSRMAAEIHLKAFIALKRGLTEDEAMKFSHHIDKLLQECAKIAPQSDLARIPAAGALAAFPAIRERYTGANLPPAQLWHAYRTAQCISAAVVRYCSGRDIRPQVLGNPSVVT